MHHISEVLDKFIHFIHQPNWPEFINWYESLDSYEKQTLANQYNFYLFQEAVFYHNLDIIKFICQNNYLQIFQYIALSDLSIFRFIYDIHQPDTFKYLYENAPSLLKSQILHFFFNLALHTINFKAPSLIFNVLNLSREHLTQVVHFNDHLIINTAIQRCFPQIIDDLIYHHDDKLLEMVKEHEFLLLRTLVLRGFLGQIYQLFNYYPEHIRTFIKANQYQLFRLACDTNQPILVHYLIEKAPDLVFKMIRAQKFHGFLIACVKGYETIIHLLKDLWSHHPQYPQYILTYKNFLAIQSTMAVENQELCLEFIKIVKPQLIKSAYHLSRCQLFEVAVKNHHDIIAKALLDIYEKEKINITPSLISVFVDKGFFIHFGLFQRIIDNLDDDIIMDLIRVNDYENLKLAFQENQFSYLDVLMGSFTTVKAYRETIEVLRAQAAAHSSWLEIHSYLASIQEMTLSFTTEQITKILPEYQPVIEHYPQEHRSKALLLYQKTIQNLEYFPTQLTQYLHSLKTLSDIIIQSETPIEDISYHYFHFNLSILELIIRQQPLMTPIQQFKKWNSYYPFLKVIEANIQHNIPNLFDILPFKIIYPELEKIAHQHITDGLIAYYSCHQELWNAEENTKIKKIIACFIVDKEIQKIFLEEYVQPAYLNYLWLNYFDIQQLMKASFLKIKRNTPERQLLNKLMQQKDYHPLALDFLVMLPTFQNTLLNKYHCFQICVLENLFLAIEPLLEFKTTTQEEIKALNDSYESKLAEHDYNHVQHIKTHFFAPLKENKMNIRVKP